MTPRLSDYGRDFYSQDGEDGIIHHIFERIGVKYRVAVEFGASDGLSCSNTAVLWRDNGWKALLIEPDEVRFEELQSNAEGFDTICRNDFVTPHGGHSIDAMLKAEGINGGVDLMTIDVDGADYQIWECVRRRVRVVCIEYNRSIPPHVRLRQADVLDSLGQSAAALVELARAKDYQLVGLTPGNLFFVVSEEASAFDEFERDLVNLFDYTALTYIITDYLGHTACIGEPPWGVAGPYLGDTTGFPLQPIAQAGGPRDPFLGMTLERLRQAYEDIYAGSVYIGLDWYNMADVDGPAPERLNDLLRLSPPLVLVDISQVSNLDLLEWITPAAERLGYSCRKTGPLLSLVRQS